MSKKCQAVLLVNLGSPTHPNSISVARFLRQFLWDRHVVKVPRIFWFFILHFVVLPFRSPKVAKLYKKIWTENGSPLINYTQNLANKLESFLLGNISGNMENESNSKSYDNSHSVSVYVAMTYGTPSIKDMIKKIHEEQFMELIVVPLFPQYSETTTGAIFDSIAYEFKKYHSKYSSKYHSKSPKLHFISEYYHAPSYINALSLSIQNHWERFGKQQRLLFSFHGLPIRQIKRGDPYLTHCQETAKKVVEKLNLPDNYWKIAFQSRFGAGEWLRPSIEEQLKAWVDEGVHSVLVIAPAFAVDCLETREELEIRAKELFIQLGGVNFHYIDALNDSDSHVAALASIIRQHLIN